MNASNDFLVKVNSLIKNEAAFLFKLKMVSHKHIQLKNTIESLNLEVDFRRKIILYLNGNLIIEEYSEIYLLFKKETEEVIKNPLYDKPTIKRYFKNQLQVLLETLSKIETNWPKVKEKNESENIYKVLSDEQLIYFFNFLNSFLPVVKGIDKCANAETDTMTQSEIKETINNILEESTSTVKDLNFPEADINNLFGYLKKLN
ncbi:MAG: hypothetical protein CVU05_06025 [Bacteroidetes bacterium HGW-Bacteroidetes-21]|jgi:hypothetical protein|nr:MAG: hypothetical protein CVU05_06025 [Bacteroidetes bacterium HGW-Bacteroidetes-21]